jgi:hypothetical protein
LSLEATGLCIARTALDLERETPVTVEGVAIAVNWCDTSRIAAIRREQTAGAND